MISPRGATRSEQDAVSEAEQRGFADGMATMLALAIELHEREGDTAAADRLRRAELSERKAEGANG